MFKTNSIVRTFALGDVVPEQKVWLVSNLAAVLKVIKVWDEQIVVNPHATNLFGIPRQTLAKVAPEAANLSGYVNLGMAGLSRTTVRANFDTGFQYRATSASGAFITEDGQLYLSGFPGGIVPITPHGDDAPWPAGASVSAVQFHLGKETRQWTVTIVMRYRRKKPNPR